MTGDDIQPLAPDAKVAGSAKEADVVESAGKKKDEEEAPEMSFVEKLALKVAKLTGSVPTELVVQEKVGAVFHNYSTSFD